MKILDFGAEAFDLVAGREKLAFFVDANGIEIHRDCRWCDLDNGRICHPRLDAEGKRIYSDDSSSYEMVKYPAPIEFHGWNIDGTPNVIKGDKSRSLVPEMRMAWVKTKDRDKVFLFMPSFQNCTPVWPDHLNGSDEVGIHRIVRPKGHFWQGITGIDMASGELLNIPYGDIREWRSAYDEYVRGKG